MFIHLAAMSDLDHKDDQLIISDLINYTVVADPDSKQIIETF